MEASSSINEAHPDDPGTDAEADKFFGGDEAESNGAEPAETKAETKAAAEPEPEALTEEEQAKVDAALKGDDAKDKKRGPVERDYIVFQEVPLTEKVLSLLLDAVKAGGEPRVAYFELHRPTARNVSGAMTATWNAHKSTLGEKADMAAIAGKSFHKRHVEPREIRETQLAISS